MNIKEQTFIKIGGKRLFDSELVILKGKNSPFKSKSQENETK